MTRSIFDPDNADVLQKGSRFVPRAPEQTHMPPDVTDGEVSEQEVREIEGSDPRKTDPDTSAELEQLHGVVEDETEAPHQHGRMPTSADDDEMFDH
ncbi:MAG: hypothetical protein ACRDJ5_12195 [Actinomycetota bacterium]